MPAPADAAHLDERRRRLLAARRKTARETGAERLARRLAEAGIDHVYGIGGTPIDGLFGACVRIGIRCIGARHQQGACLMSLAHNFVAGRLRSAVLVSAGPAASNCSTGVLFAHDNRWPLLVLAGRLPSGPGRPGAFQDFDAAGFHAPLLRFGDRIRHAVDADDSLGRALAACSGPVPGAVWIDIDADALAGAVGTDSGPLGREPAAAASVDATALDEAARALARARRPIVLLGTDLRWSSPWTSLRRLVDEYGLAFAAAPMARGFLPDSHPLCVGTERAAALASADLVVTAGARFDWTFRHGAELSADARLLRIDADPAEAARTLGRGVGLSGDPGVVLAALLDRLAEGARSGPSARDPNWPACLSDRRASPAPLARPVDTGDADVDGDGLPASDWLAELAVALPPDAITVLDGNIIMTRAQRAIPVEHPVSRLGPGNNGTMGVGLPFAIGARFACPQRPVVLISGDFAFGVNAMEFETAVRYRVPLLAVVSNNRGPGGSTRHRQFLPPDCPEPVLRLGEAARYDRLAEALGGVGHHVRWPGELAARARAILDAGATGCIDVRSRDDDSLLASI